MFRPPPAQDESAAIQCPECDRPFGVFLWRHLCRACGFWFCDDCTQARRTIPKFGYTSPERVCSLCFLALAVESKERAVVQQISMPILRKFAAQRGINITGCLEKGDVVRVIILECDKLAQQQAARRQAQRAQQTQQHNQHMRHTVNTNAPFTGSFHQHQSVPPPQNYPPYQEAAWAGQAYNPPPQNNPFVHNPYVQQPVSPHPQNNPFVPSPVQVPAPAPEPMPYNGLESLKVPELRQVLTRHGLSHDDCLEKADLIKKIQSIEKNAAPDPQTTPPVSAEPEKPTNEADVCIICMESPIETVFLECGHMGCCRSCAKACVDCPLCRRPISRVVNVFHAKK